MGRFSIYVAALWLAAMPAPAKEVAVDISGSIDEEEARLQREGYVNAILHPDVMRAIQSGMLRRVAVTYMEWAGLYQNVLVDWHLIEDQRGAAVFAQKLNEAPIFTSA